MVSSKGLRALEDDCGIFRGDGELRGRPAKDDGIRINAAAEGGIAGKGQ